MANVHCNPHLTRYILRSSDVISDMRVNVIEEKTDKVLWYSERFLTDHEIVENVVNNATSAIHWTIHRPKRGWYIRLRSPSFPKGVAIALTPLPRTSPHYTDAALTFGCRTSTPPPAPPQQQAAYLSQLFSPSPRMSVSSTIGIHTRSPPGSAKQSFDSTTSTVTVHSYPPTPPVPVHPSPTVSPPSPRAVEAELDKLAVSEGDSSSSLATGSRLQPGDARRSPAPPAQNHITQFILAPHSATHTPQPDAPPSLFQRAISAFHNNRPSHSCSFTLSPLPAASASDGSPDTALASSTFPAAPRPLLVFHDQTPTFNVYSFEGLLELNEGEASLMGVEVSFWVAVALTYLEFLGERESYLAASTD